MSAAKPIPAGHLYFACGLAAGVSGHRFQACLPGYGRAGDLQDGQGYACYLLVTACGISQAQIAREYRVSPATVSRKVATIASQRDDLPMLESAISAAEMLCMSTFNIRI